MSIVSSLFVNMRRSADESIGDEMARPEVMSKRHMLVLIKDSCEIWMVPNSRSQVILIPRRCSGSPRS